MYGLIGKMTATAGRRDDPLPVARRGSVDHLHCYRGAGKLHQRRRKFSVERAPPMRFLPYSVLLALVGLPLVAAARREQAPMGLFLPDAVPWKAGPTSLRPGTRMAILEGDPSRDGMFTMRLMLPDGFEVRPHWHSQIEHVTIISGVLHFGMGERFDRQRTRPMPPGAFGYWPVGMRHFAWAEGETVLQLHGRGPWTVTYVNPADDPRKHGQ